jgi:hypothetical protein
MVLLEGIAQPWLIDMGGLHLLQFIVHGIGRISTRFI